MNVQAGLTQKLRKIEALVEGAGTDAERDAAEAARARVQAQLEAERQADLCEDELVLDLNAELLEA
jgi:hypothetical protein